MLDVLCNRSYAKLFSAQIIALLGTGLLTVALGLLAFDVAGSQAGLVLGLAMTIKMAAYVAVAPLINAIVGHIPRKLLLIGADLTRAAVAMFLPFVSEAWQIYMLILVLQSASATFTPAFQAIIPSILPEEREYTRALSLSRLAYDMESLVSPLLAALLLTATSYHNLFLGTVAGFCGSAVLVSMTRFPEVAAPGKTTFLHRLTGGLRAFWARPELRGLMALNLVVATTTAMVIVNTVVLVKGGLGRSQTDAALLLGAYGAGSMIVALSVPRLLDRFPDRRVMLGGASCLPPLLMAAACEIHWGQGTSQWIALMATWLLTGAATATILTPSSRLLRRNSTEQDRPGIFAAQFSLSHACFLLTYPLAGAAGAAFGLAEAAIILVGVGLLGTFLAFFSWRSGTGVGAVDENHETT
ncbi:MFS transporter [Glutamicibacter halophytocola]|uniref:MFS transporter n=1 Tax=Glutamicibacter halophytocola TaxID=1933880 RepID=UPI0015C567FB|nr:MFS transporter [Glutamicibacter halophytocola]NQD42804.1 MFS transporter [Glutamicibacter halophytocola]